MTSDRKAWSRVIGAELLVTDDWSLIASTSLRLVEGAIAQLGERLLCKQEVVGSIPSGSTSPLAGPKGW